MPYNTPCPKGRLQVAALAAMNVRTGIEPASLQYISVPLRRPRLVESPQSARYQPRRASGKFALYADLAIAINVDYAMTAFEFDGFDGFDDFEGFDGLDHFEGFDGFDEFDGFELPDSW